MAQHVTAHGRSVGCIGRGVWLFGGAAWGCAGAQRGTAQGHRAVPLPLSVCSSPLGCAASCWRSDRGEHWAGQAQGAGREQRHLTPGFWCCPVPVPPGGGGGASPRAIGAIPRCLFIVARGVGGSPHHRLLEPQLPPWAVPGHLTPGCWRLRRWGGGGARSVGRRFPSFWGPCRFMAQGT